MKFLGGLIAIIITLVVGAYVVLFTGIGNSMLQPVVEKKIQENSGMNIRLSKFSLSMSDFSIVLELDSQNIIYLNGNYSISSKAFNAAYRVAFDRLENLRDIAGAKISGKLHTDGVAKGDMAFIEIDGKSDIASSQTTYHVELTDLNPTSIIAKINKAKLSELLVIGAQSPYAKADVDLDVNFKSIKAHELDGSISLKTSKGSLNTKVMKDDFDIDIPQTAFAMNLDAKLLKDDVDYKYLLKSNLANLSSSGKVKPQPLSTDIKYILNVANLEVLKPITGADIRGGLKVFGTLKGSKDSMALRGQTNLASSNTNFNVMLKDFAPASIKAKIRGLDISESLYMLKQPHYADAFMDMDVDIKDARAKNLSGSITTNLYDGVFDSKLLTKEYQFKHAMPKTYFKAKAITKLDKNIVDTKLGFGSNIANLEIQSAKFDISDASIKSDYKAYIPNLDKLYFVSDKRLKGELKVNGELKKAKDLEFSAFSNVAGGEIVANLNNDDFRADLKGVNTLKLLEMLIYPQVIDSLIDANLKYNLATQKGYFDGDITKGKFTQNQMLDLAKQFGNVDLYKETFQGDVNADIDKEKILSAIYLVGRTSHIRTKDAKIDTKKNTVDADIDINANNHPIKVKVKGDLNSPKVKVDAGDLLKDQATKALQKKLGDKVGGDVGNLLKSFF
jgi:hypothetical protein